MNERAYWQIQERLTPEQIVRRADEEQERVVRDAINAHYRNVFARARRRLVVQRVAYTILVTAVCVLTILILHAR